MMDAGGPINGTLRVKVTEVTLLDDHGERVKQERKLQQYLHGHWQDVPEHVEKIRIGPSEGKSF